MISVWEDFNGFYIYYKSLFPDISNYSDFPLSYFLFFGGSTLNLLDFLREWWVVFILSWHLSPRYMCVGGLLGSWPQGRRRGKRKIWCLHVALVTGITSLLMRACPPRKPGFNFPFEMGTGPCCQFRFHWSAVWQILAPWGYFFCSGYPLAFLQPCLVGPTVLIWVGWMALILLLPNYLKRTTLATIVGWGRVSPQGKKRWWKHRMKHSMFW